ncbi:MAG: UDP-N-acetylenolpyruvoylglucosamine reductase [Gammaproteobacteria bacterium]|nr:MAG: UDP-N-acetylenolpyruvoylglucosamine reductase [Gammaproteobacteria bacterium]
MIVTNKDLSEFNSLQIAVNAKYYLECKTDSEIEQAFQFIKKNKIKFLILGEGTNVVFTKPYDGLIIKNSFKKEKKIYKNKVKVSSGYNWDRFVRFCIKNSLYGLENLSGIPGTVGAGPIQNIGAYGEEISDYIEHIEVFNLKTGNVEILNNMNCNFDYRDSLFKKHKHLFIKNVFFKLKEKFIANNSYQDLQDYRFKKASELRQGVLRIRNQKLENYLTKPNVGSFFKNPLINKKDLKKLLSEEADLKFYKHDALIKVSAAWLIERCNLKGMQFNKARVSKKHSLVLINEDKSPNSILKLKNKVKTTVSKKYNIRLEEEPTII